MYVMMKKTLLLVDDDVLIRDILKSALEMDYRVLEADCYEAAVRLVAQPIDFAIIDYLLPDRDGFEVLRALRETYPALPAIMMTGHSNENVVIKAIRSTVADYIKKPLNLAYLRLRVSQILRETQGNGPLAHMQNSEESILEGVAGYIKENYMKDVTLDQLSRMACMNRFKFCRAFKKKFGKSFVSYTNKIRIDRADDLLRNTDLNIIDIAYLVGFQSVVHFGRIFKRIHGIAPREYRARRKHEP
jgi:YesN/AraC family two-component response regulator